jgi:hypothetical protein
LEINKRKLTMHITNIKSHDMWSFIEFMHNNQILHEDTYHGSSPKRLSDLLSFPN